MIESQSASRVGSVNAKASKRIRPATLQAMDLSESESDLPMAGKQGGTANLWIRP